MRRDLKSLTPEQRREAMRKLGKARASKERAEADAGGLTVAEYRARRRAARAETHPTETGPFSVPTRPQVEPDVVAATLPPPPAGTPQPEAAGPVAEASSTPVSP